MTKTKPELATAQIRVFPRTRQKLKIQASKKGMTLAELVEEVSSKKKTKDYGSS